MDFQVDPEILKENRRCVDIFQPDFSRVRVIQGAGAESPNMKEQYISLV
jgi:hypothetical protein